jgi:hypothetical protein
MQICILGTEWNRHATHAKNSVMRYVIAVPFGGFDFTGEGRLNAARKNRRACPVLRAIDRANRSKNLKRNR